MKLFESRRVEPEWKNPDPRIRRIAVGRLEDPALLSQISHSDDDESVRERARDTLQRLAVQASSGPALSALAAIEDEGGLAAVARSAHHEDVARAALGRVTEVRYLSSVARQSTHPIIRMEAVGRIQDPTELASVALRSDERDVALAALERIAGLFTTERIPPGGLEELLKPVAERARVRAAARRARAVLRGGEPHPEEEQAHHPSTDRRRQTQICEAMEALAHNDDVEPLALKITETRNAWIDLVPSVDDDLQERFDQATQAAKQALARNQQEREESRRREAERTEEEARLAGPRLALCEEAESIQELESAGPHLRRLAEEWSRLGTLEGEAGRLLQRRFDAACQALEEKIRAWRHERDTARHQADEARHQAEEESARLAREAKEKQNLVRIQQIAVRVERLLAAETPTLKSLQRAARDLKSALENHGPLPAGKDRSTALAQLRHLQNDIQPKIRDERLTEDWKLWVNAGIQEELCREAEGLKEIEDAEEAGRRLTGIQNRWRNSSTVSRDRAQELWLRFKAVRDEVRTRLDASRVQQAERKEALCAQAEQLAPSSDWVRTAEALKKLQEEWKNIGPAGPSRDRALWERFRGACDQFFTRRKEDLKQRKQEWSKNLQAREDLCVQAEGLAESSDWDATATMLKKLQSDWKGIGPVSRKDSDATWLRFRTACDKFFDRFKRRHENRREAVIAGRESVVQELEALLPLSAGEAAAIPMLASSPGTGGSGETVEAPGTDAFPGTPDGAVAAPAAEAIGESGITAPAAPSVPAGSVGEGVTPAEAAALSDSAASMTGAGETVATAEPAPAVPTSPEGLVERLRNIHRKWHNARTLPREQGAALEARYWTALGRIMDSFPEALKDSEFDSSRNRARMQELVDRVENLLTDKKGLDTSGLSPASQLAAMWVEAMAANTIGGGVGDDAMLRAAVEEVHRAQALWQRIGYVPDSVRRSLNDRFEQACRRVLDRGQRLLAPTPEFRAERPARAPRPPRAGAGRKG